MRTLLVVLALIPQLSCLPSTEYKCSGNSDCPGRGGSSGVCESIGYCSYEDNACEFGRRFSEYAADRFAEQCVPCPMNGILTSDGNCYLESNGATSWNLARDECARIPGNSFHLVKIDKAEENQILDDLFSGDLWIGGSDQASEGKWVWTDGSAIDSGPWASGEPSTDPVDDCLLFDARDAEWEATDCNENHGFVCERP